MLYGWEDNRHRLSGISTYGLNGIGKGDEHPSCAPLEYYGIFYLTSVSKHQTEAEEKQNVLTNITE